MTYHITPTLTVDTPAPALSPELVAWKLRNGEQVKVPTVEVAREVLLRLGMPEAEADRAIRFATTGSF